MVLKFLLNIQMWCMIFLKNIEEYNPNKKRKLLIILDDMIADTLSIKKLNPMVPA